MKTNLAIAKITSCSATVRTLLLTAPRFALSLLHFISYFLFIYFLLSPNFNFSKSAQCSYDKVWITTKTQNSFTRPAYIPGKENTTAYIHKDKIENASSGSRIYLLHQLPQTFTKDCSS